MSEVARKLFGDPRPQAAQAAPQLLPVPAVQQETDFSCGAAALLAVLRFFGAAGPEEGEASLYERLSTSPELGTDPEMIAREARTRGLDANWRTGVTVDDLRAATAQGTPVILDLQDPDDGAIVGADGHYVVAVGASGRRVYVMNPSLGAVEAIRLADLEQRWFDGRAQRGAIFVSRGTR